MSSSPTATAYSAGEDAASAASDDGRWPGWRGKPLPHSTLHHAARCQHRRDDMRACDAGLGAVAPYAYELPRLDSRRYMASVPRLLESGSRLIEAYVIT